MLIDNRTMSSNRLEETTKICIQCHGAIPEYETLEVLHNIKGSFNCSFCHRDKTALKATDRVHTGLRWFGIGMVGVVVTGLITSLIINSRADRVA